MRDSIVSAWEQSGLCGENRSIRGFRTHSGYLRRSADAVIHTDTRVQDAVLVL